MQSPLISIKHLHIHLAPQPLPALGEFVPGTLETAAPPNAARFELSPDGQMVTDHKTGLMWPVVESESSMDYDALEKYVAAFSLGGFTDWRIPTVEERESIRDLTRYKPALFEPFQSRSNEWEWTGTPVAWRIENGSPQAFFQVDGSYGYLGYDNRGSKAFARPCRFVARASQ